MEKVRLGDICVLHYGKSLTANKRINGNVPVYSSAGLIGYHNVPLVNNRGIIIGRKGTVGKVYKTDKPFYCIDTAFYILPDDDVYDFDYLYYCLKSLGLENLNEDSAVPGLNRETAYSQLIYFPKIEIQKKIAKILSDIDVKIKNNNKINDNLLNQALTIYNHKIKTFHKNGCIGDYCTVKSGFAFKSAWWVDKGIKVIKISSINQDYLNIHECSFVSADKQEKAKDFAVTFGDLLIAMTGATIGKFAMVPYTSETLLVNQRVGKFYLGNNPIEKLPFIYCTLKQSDVYTEIIHRGQGSAQANISASDIMNVSCSIPQNDIINEFNYITMPLFNLILKNQYENENLKLLRNTLLPKLMSKNFSLSNIQI